MNYIKILSSSVALFLLSVVSAHAQVNSPHTGPTNEMPAAGSLDSFSGTIIGFIDTTLVPLIFAIAFIVFLWGVFKYFIAGGASDEKQKEGRTFIMYAIIGFVLMFSLWGIVRLFTNSLGFDSDTRPPTPTFGS